MKEKLALGAATFALAAGSAQAEQYSDHLNRQGGCAARVTYLAVGETVETIDCDKSFTVGGVLAKKILSTEVVINKDNFVLNPNGTTTNKIYFDDHKNSVTSVYDVHLKNDPIAEKTITYKDRWNLSETTGTSTIKKSGHGYRPKTYHYYPKSDK